MKKKIFILMAFLGLVTLLLVGCGKSSPQPSQLPPTIKPAVSVPAASVLVPSPTPEPASNPPDSSTAVMQSGLPLTVTTPIDGAFLTTDTILVKGQTKPGAIVTVNESVGTADQNGSFNITISLEEGLNAVDVIASDDSGKQGEMLLMVQLDLSSAAVPSSTGSSPDSSGDSNTLALNITQPADGASLNSGEITVIGKTVPEAVVIVNDQVDIADGSGNFSIPISLDSGPGVIDVIASDDDGDQAEVMLMVNVGS
jgi:hypothetical protein